MKYSNFSGVLLVAIICSEITVVLPESIRNFRAFRDYSEGTVLFAQHRYDESISKFQLAAALVPDEPLYHFGIGLSCAYRMKTEPSLYLASENCMLVNFQRAIRLRPKDPMFHLNYGWALQEIGKYSDAITEIHAAELLDPSDPLYSISMALWLDKNGKQHEATSLYAQTIAQNPSIEESLFFKNLQKTDVERSKYILWEALNLSNQNSPIALAKRGGVLISLGKFDQARIEIEEALRGLPNLPLAWFNLGRIESNANHLELANKYYLRAQTLDPSNFQVMKALSSEHMLNGNIEAAVRLDIQILLEPIWTAHARRLSKVYGFPSIDSNDALPATLVMSLSPVRDEKDICSEVISYLSFPNNKIDTNSVKIRPLVESRCNELIDVPMH
jgi:tetratricopeptide (TPR) repeat protein